MTSQKEGYVLTAMEGTVGDFKAYALAGVSFEVMCFKGCFIEGNKPHRKCRVSFTHGHTYCRRHLSNSEFPVPMVFYTDGNVTASASQLPSPEHFCK